MVIAHYTQSDVESKTYKFDYAAWLDAETVPAETVLSFVTNVNTTGLTITQPTVLPGETSLSITVSDGVPDTEYVVAIVVTTSAGQIKEDCVRFTITSTCTTEVTA